MRHPVLCALSLAWLWAAAPALAAGPAVKRNAPALSAFYYPWFATTVADGSYAHWAQEGHSPPDDIASIYYQVLGVYSSDDPSVLGDQMAEIQRAGSTRSLSRGGGGGRPRTSASPPWSGPPARTASLSPSTSSPTRAGPSRALRPRSLT